MDERTRKQLLESVELALAGQPFPALPDHPDPEVAVAVALINHAGGYFHQAVKAFQQVARVPEWRVLGLTRVVATAGALGWDRERFEASEQLRQTGTPTLRLDLNELTLRGRLGDAEGVAVLARRLLATEPNHVGLRLELASALARMGALDELRAELKHLTVEHEPPRLEVLLERARLHVEANELDEAQALVERAHALWPEEVLPLISLARLSAWRGEGGEAWARRALALGADSADAWCALGAALPPGAEASAAFARACELDRSHGEAHTFLAEEAHAVGDRAAVDRALNVAVLAAGRQLPVTAWLLRALGALDPGEVYDLTGYRTEEVSAALEELSPGAGDQLKNAGPATATEVLRAALTASRRNRGVQATLVREGKLRRLVTRTGPRLGSREALERVRYEDPERVAQRLEALADRYPQSSMPLVHRGEVWLWVGRLEEAEADFRRAIARVSGTRFAWIGLTGVELLRGRLEAALEVCQAGIKVMRDTSGPAVFVYRGEVYRRLGRLEEAQADLEAAVAATPRRLSAWMNLALVRHARGHHPEAAALFAKVEDCAPALMSDARRELGGEPSPARQVEHALQMMHGNRSSSTVLYESGGVLRGVPNRPGSAAEVHRKDPQNLKRLKATLLGRHPLLRVFAT